ncbi:hypothetical protein [Bacillus subtilis]|uniref:hypothetical protein n=1 Tax=Bacillus subtilis TaxID=1423 RepID=UPI0024BFA3A6|nr:hypothetical protein [Bacillus subtilis]MDK1002621.1 hypothetical protein [Bacillus subtilis]
MNMNERLRRKVKEKGSASAMKRELRRLEYVKNFDRSEYEKAEEDVRNFYRQREMMKVYS